MGMKAYHLLSLSGILLRGEQHDLHARGRRERSCHHCHRCDCASDAMKAVKAPSSSRAGESANDRFWVETQDNHHPLPPFVKAPSPPSLPQHRWQFTRLRCFQAAQKKATKAPSCARFPPRYSPDEAPSIPIGDHPNGVTEATSVAFMCGHAANAA